MKRKYLLKKHASNEFMALFGIEAFPLLGGSNCLIVKHLTYNGHPIQRVAYLGYISSLTHQGTSAIKVNATCGIANCVLRDHLIASYKPTKKDQEYIRDNLYLGHEFLTNALRVPSKLFEQIYPVPDSGQR